MRSTLGMGGEGVHAGIDVDHAETRPKSSDNRL